MCHDPAGVIVLSQTMIGWSAWQERPVQEPSECRNKLLSAIVMSAVLAVCCAMVYVNIGWSTWPPSKPGETHTHTLARTLKPL